MKFYIILFMFLCILSGTRFIRSRQIKVSFNGSWLKMWRVSFSTCDIFLYCLFPLLLTLTLTLWREVIVVTISLQYFVHDRLVKSLPVMRKHFFKISGNSKAKASKLYEYLQKMFPSHYMHINVCINTHNYVICLWRVNTAIFQIVLILSSITTNQYITIPCVHTHIQTHICICVCIYIHTHMKFCAKHFQF